MRTLFLLLLSFLAVSVTLSASAQENSVPFAAFDKASEAVLNDPHDLEIGPDGRLYVADKFGSRIAVLDAETLELLYVIEDGKLPGVHDISFGADGRVAVSVTGLGAVFVYDKFGSSGVNRSQILYAPRTEGVLIHSNGRIYAMGSGNGTLIAYEGEEAVAVASGHLGAHDVGEAADGSIWVADAGNARLVKYSPDLELLQVLDDPKFGFIGPRYLDVDEFGRLVVADQDAHRILMIDPDGPDGGTLIGVLGTGVPGKGPNLFDDPEGVEVHESRYYFSDSDNNRIVRYVLVTN